MSWRQSLRHELSATGSDCSELVARAKSDADLSVTSSGRAGTRKNGRWMEGNRWMTGPTCAQAIWTLTPGRPLTSPESAELLVTQLAFNFLSSVKAKEERCCRWKMPWLRAGDSSTRWIMFCFAYSYSYFRYYSIFMCFSTFLVNKDDQNGVHPLHQWQGIHCWF